MKVFFLLLMANVADSFQRRFVQPDPMGHINGDFHPGLKSLRVKRGKWVV